MAMVPSCTVPAVAAGAGIAIPIVHNGDFVIRLAYPMTPLAESSSVNSARRSVEFLVSRGIMITHSVFFRDLFHVQPTLTIVCIDNPDCMKSALEIWLRAIHGSTETSVKAHHSKHVWAAIAVGEKFGFMPGHVGAIKPWFLAYYDETLANLGLIPMVARILAYPCAVFDHAEGFMKLTKYLVYNTTSSTFTQNPFDFDNLRNDARLLDGPLGAARARIQRVIEFDLSSPLKKLHMARCTCRKRTAFDYEDALVALGCWPVMNALNMLTLAEYMDKLTQFTFTPEATRCDSGACHQDFRKAVDVSVDRAKYYFQGLCLDCMNRSKSSTGQSNGEYIEKNSPYKGCWDMDCRFGHKRETWFYSWMGPSAARQQIVLKVQREMRQQGQSGNINTEPRGKRTAKITTKRDRLDSHGHDKHTSPSVDAVYPIVGFHGHGQQIGDHEERDGSLHIDDDDEFFDAEDAHCGDFGVQGGIDV